jgi:hypothetical protein
MVRVKAGIARSGLLMYPGILRYKFLSTSFNEYKFYFCNLNSTRITMVSLYKNAWKLSHASVCCIRFLNDSDIEIVSTTGFKAGDYLFTHDMINRIHNKAQFVEIRFVKEDGHTNSAFERLTLHDFNERIITSYDQEITGFAVISLADLTFDSIPSLQLGINRHIYIGQAVALVGYQYDNPSLTIKAGILSTVMHRNSTRYLQFDGNTIWGNAGSPLIDLKTNECGNRL